MPCVKLDVHSVVVTEEHHLAPIATLGDVVRHIRHERASELFHAATMAEAGNGQKSLVDPNSSERFA